MGNKPALPKNKPPFKPQFRPTPKPQYDDPSRSWTRVIWVLLLTAVGFAGYQAWKSPLFVVRGVELVDFPNHAPLSPDFVRELAAVSIEKETLFQVDLAQIRHRLESHPWIKWVDIEKRFPTTIWVQVHFREPVAMVQYVGGAASELSYVEGDGTVFGPVELAKRADLPVLSGIQEGDRVQLEEALGLVHEWQESGLNELGRLSSVNYDLEKGYRLMVTYSGSAAASKGRALVEIGHKTDTDFDFQLKQLHRVFEYLGKNSVQAHQIFVGDGKKVVVRTGHRS